MKTSLLLVLSLLLYQYTNVQARNSAVCFLTESPAFDTLRFAEKLTQSAIQYDMDVFIMIDINYLNVSGVNVSSDVRLLQISNQECIKYGYQNTISLHPRWREITSWDKALLYFVELNKSYSFVWLIEKDVFIPSDQAFYSLHELYSHTSDLIIPHNEINLLADSSYWHWHMTVGKFIPPWSASMVNVVGFSRRMLIAISDYVRWRGEVPFHEFFFNTLAMQSNMTTVVPTELDTIFFQRVHTLEDVQNQPSNFWHPVKDLKKQQNWRETLVNTTLNDNNTIEFNNVEILCLTSQSTALIEERLTKLFVKFEKIKNQLSMNIRLSLQRRFSLLAHQCQHRSDSKQIVFLAKQLADHAYKLPEPLLAPLVASKSSYHLKLEQALKENKETIFRLPINDSTLNGLRKQAINLTKELTLEILREHKEEGELLNQPKPPPSTPMATSLRPLSASSSSSTAIKTNITPQLIAPSAMTTVKMNRTVYILQRENDDHNHDYIEDKTEVLFLTLYIFCTLCVLLSWKKLRNQKHLTIITTFLLLCFCWYIVVYHMNTTFW